MRRLPILLVALAACAQPAQKPPEPMAASRPAAAPNACLALPAPRNPACFQRQPPPTRPGPSVDKPYDPNDGSLSKEQINTEVRKHLLEIKCCYERELESRPDLAGALVVGWRIEPSGSVSRSWVVKSSLPSEPALACIGDRVCDWRFPADAFPTTVGRYPFVFKIGGVP